MVVNKVVTKVVIVVPPNTVVTTAGVAVESAGQLHSVELADSGEHPEQVPIADAVVRVVYVARARVYRQREPGRPEKETYL